MFIPIYHVSFRLRYSDGRGRCENIDIIFRIIKRLCGADIIRSILQIVIKLQDINSVLQFQIARLTITPNTRQSFSRNYGAVLEDYYRVTAHQDSHEDGGVRVN